MAASDGGILGSIRRMAIEFLNRLAISLENPQDSLQRIQYYNLRLPVVRVAIDLDLFDILSASNKPMTTQELAKKTEAAPLFLERILRYLASTYMIDEVDEDTFAANKTTRIFKEQGFKDAIRFNFDALGPVYQALPEFARENKHDDIVDPNHCPFQKGHNTDLPCFKFLPTRPDLLKYFTSFMEAHHKGMPQFVDVYPAGRMAGRDPKLPLFVDIGGGNGHQAALFHKRFPQLPGRIVVQDLKHAVELATPKEGLEFMAFDFWTPQTVKAWYLGLGCYCLRRPEADFRQGAKFYYMRHIMHNYTDPKCVELLKNTVAGMGEDSVILLDEIVLPPVQVSRQPAQIDISMMCVLAATERTKKQWEVLMEMAGLTINHIYQYSPVMETCIIEVVPAKGSTPSSNS